MCVMGRPGRVRLRRRAENAVPAPAAAGRQRRVNERAWGRGHRGGGGSALRCAPACLPARLGADRGPRSGGGGGERAGARGGSAGGGEGGRSERGCRGARRAALPGSEARSLEAAQWEGARSLSRAGPPAWGQRCGPGTGRARPGAARRRSRGGRDEPRGRRAQREPTRVGGASPSGAPGPPRPPLLGGLVGGDPPAGESKRSTSAVRAAGEGGVCACAPARLPVGAGGWVCRNVHVGG